MFSWFEQTHRGQWSEREPIMWCTLTVGNSWDHDVIATPLSNLIHVTTPSNWLLHQVKGEPTYPKSHSPQKSRAALNPVICPSLRGATPVFSSALTISLKSPTQNHGRSILGIDALAVPKSVPSWLLLDFRRNQLTAKRHPLLGWSLRQCEREKTLVCVSQSHSSKRELSRPLYSILGQCECFPAAIQNKDFWWSCPLLLFPWEILLSGNASSPTRWVHELHVVSPFHSNSNLYSS